MPIKIKFLESKPMRVAVKVHRPAWQQFLSY